MKRSRHTAKRPILSFASNPNKPKQIQQFHYFLIIKYFFYYFISILKNVYSKPKYYGSKLISVPYELKSGIAKKFEIKAKKSQNSVSCFYENFKSNKTS